MKDYLKPYVLKLTFIVNVIFLIWHMILLFIFGYEKIWIMTVFNVFSLCIYIRTLFMLRRHHTRGVIRMMYVELLFHMLISVICMGWNLGFQEYAFGILPIIMFGDYIEDANRLRKSSIAMVLSVAGSYFGLNVWTSMNEPLYAFTSREGTRLFAIINGTATIICVSAYFLIFTHMVLGFERGLIQDASSDSLTGLSNRRVLREYREQLDAVDDYCVFMLDVDNFKHVNDTYGHDIGDRVLKEIGKLLTEYKHTLKKFMPLRWGGEEFVVIYSDGNLGREEKIRQMEVVRHQIGELHVAVPEGAIHFTATVGAAAVGEEKGIEDLIALADSRMYYGKQHGKDCMVFTHDKWRLDE